MKYRIKEHRLGRGWSQDHLAELAGVTKGYISQIENDKRDPSAETLRSLAAALQVDVTELIEPVDEDARQAIDHLAVFRRLSQADREAVARIAVGLLPDHDAA